MKRQRTFEIPPEPARQLSYSLVNATRAVALSSEASCEMTAQASVFAVALILIACAREESLSGMLSKASKILADMATCPAQLLAIKRAMAGGASLDPAVEGMTPQ